MIDFKKNDNITKEQLGGNKKLENWNEVLNYLVLQEGNGDEFSFLADEIEKLSEYTKNKIEQIQKNIIELLEATTSMAG